MAATYSVAVITCSVRKPRLNPFVSQYVLGVLSSELQKSPTINITLSTIDLADWALPLVMEESKVATHRPKEGTSETYDQPATRAWSAEISKHQAYVFVTPQYNWSFPASVKLAIDYLFHEWTGKPFMVVSYGGPHGGCHGNTQLTWVLGSGMRMKKLDTAPQLPIDKDSLFGSHTQEGFEALEQKWRESGKEEDIRQAWLELVKILTERAQTAPTAS